MYLPLKAEKTTSDNQGVCWTVNEDSSSDLCFAEIRSIKSYQSTIGMFFHCESVIPWYLEATIGPSLTELLE